MIEIMEDYKKKYKDLIDRLRKAKYDDAVNDERYCCVIDDLVPELKESEDERIRKALIRFHKSTIDIDGFKGEKILAWLEKQGDTFTKKDVDDAYLKGISDAKNELEKQGEQKPADKVGPKFKVGDWVTNGIDFTFQVRSIEDDMYLRSDDYFIDIETADKTFRLWTIKDAKDGDVLACENGWACVFKSLDGHLFQSYCFVDKTGWFCELGSRAHTLDERINGKILPATKEQRDLLFSKMKEAGYEWDAKKKELKKIEQEDVELTDFESALFSAFSYVWQEYLSGKEVNVAKWAREHSAELLEVAREQKPAWSEEDEKT